MLLVFRIVKGLKSGTNYRVINRVIDPAGYGTLGQKRSKFLLEQEEYLGATRAVRGFSYCRALSTWTFFIPLSLVLFITQLHKLPLLFSSHSNDSQLNKSSVACIFSWFHHIQHHISQFCSLMATNAVSLKSFIWESKVLMVILWLRTCSLSEIVP